MARDALSRVADCGRERLDLRLVLVHFENWMKDYRLGRFVKLSRDDEWLFIRCFNPVWCVLKYVNKAILGKDKTYAALLFASNKRMFSMSQNLMSKLNIKRYVKGQGWTFQGTIDESGIKAFCVEKEIGFGDFVKITVTIEVLYEYPQLFDAFDTV